MKIIAVFTAVLIMLSLNTVQLRLPEIKAITPVPATPTAAPSVGVNPNGGAIALGHPLVASGARLVITAMNQLHAQVVVMRYVRCALE